MTTLGVVLLIVGALVAVFEAHNPAHGVAGATGAVLVGVGAVLAISGLGAGIALGIAIGALLALGGGGAMALTVRRSAAVRHRRVRGGAEGLIGRVGIVRSWGEADGSVALDGAVWRARPVVSDDADEAAGFAAGDPVVVQRLSGLTLSVRRAEEWELL